MGTGGTGGSGGVATPPVLGDYPELGPLYVLTAGWDGAEPEQTPVIGLLKRSEQDGSTSYAFPDLIAGLGAHTITKKDVL